MPVCRMLSMHGNRKLPTAIGRWHDGTVAASPRPRAARACWQERVLGPSQPGVTVAAAAERPGAKAGGPGRRLFKSVGSSRGTVPGRPIPAQPTAAHRRPLAPEPEGPPPFFDTSRHIPMGATRLYEHRMAQRTVLQPAQLVLVRSVLARAAVIVPAAGQASVSMQTPARPQWPAGAEAWAH